MPYNGKIADITHADTDPHTLDLATALSETRKTVMIIISANRIAGANVLRAYPNEGTTGLALDTTNDRWIHTITVLSNRLKYSLSNAGDDFDLYCFGYVVEV